MGDSMNLEHVASLYSALLEELGEDVNREGLRDTPMRAARFWQEFIDYDPGNLDVTFEAIQTDQMIAVSGIKVFSLCEHHLVPFQCDVAIAYIAQKKVLGLSKLARIAHKYAHRLQLQERLVQQIANEVSELTGAPDVAVLGRGQHLCMVMRGVRTNGLMHTSVMRGVFRDNAEVRAEFLELIKGGLSG